MYQAWDPKLARHVAIKVIRGRSRDRPAYDRFIREARALAQLSHPNVVEVFDVGRYDDGRGVFLVMERLEGQTLKQWLKSETRGWRAIVETFVAAGRGIAAAHAATVVHRDFKPDNVMITTDGAVKVLDFGLAVTTEDWSAPLSHDSSAVPAAASHSGISASTRLTQTGIVLGTPRYMAPEQHHGEAVEPATDQFAFCVTLLAALRGVRGVFTGSDIEALARAKVDGRVDAAPSDDRTPAWLEAVVLRGLRPEPADRWPTMEALLDALQPPRRFRWLGAGVLAAAVATGVGALALGGAQDPGPRGCEAGASRLDEVFARPRLEPITGGIDALPQPAATEARQLLDRWVAASTAQWKSTHAQACHSHEQGTLDDLAFDRRMSCLRTVTDAWRRTVDRLARDPSKVGGGLADALTRAPVALRCTEPTPSELSRPVPTDPDLRARVEQARTTLAEIGAASQHEQIEVIEQRLEALRVEAVAIGFLALQAEVASGKAEFIRQRGDYAAALVHFDEAVAMAQSADDDELAARASTHATFMVAARMEDAVEARKRLVHTRTLLDRAGKPPRLVLEASQAEFAVLFSEANYAQAEQVCLDALEGFPRETDGQRLDAATLVMNAGIAALQRGQLDVGVARLRENLEIREAVVGPNHVTVGNSLMNIGHALQTQSKYEESLQAYTRGYEILRDHPSANIYLVAQILSGMGMIHKHRGEYERARERTAAALKLLREGPDPDHLSIPMMMMNLGHIDRDLGRDRDAMDIQRRALKMRERLLEPDHPDVGVSLGVVGRLELRARNFDAAQPLLLRALEIKRKVAGSGDRGLLHIYIDLIVLEVRRGWTEAAAPYVDAARTICDGLDDGDELVGACWSALGQAERERGHGPQGEQLLRRALAVAEQTGASAGAIGDARMELAQSLRAQGQTDAAGEVLAQAMEELRADGPGSAARLAEAEALMAAWE